MAEDASRRVLWLEVPTGFGSAEELDAAPSPRQATNARRVMAVAANFMRGIPTWEQRDGGQWTWTRRASLMDAVERYLPIVSEDRPRLLHLFQKRFRVFAESPTAC